MTNEHTGICIYEKGRFELRETDNAIIDLKGDFPPIMIASNTVDDGSEPNCADTRGVFHLLNELADNNPNEERHWYLKKMLDKSWKQYHEQKDENEQLKSEIEKLSYANEDLLSEKRNWQRMSDEYCKLSEENEQLEIEIADLKYENKNLKINLNACKRGRKQLVEENEQLKQQLNYIQNSISEHIKHQKTELGQKALKEIIEDYNEWLLGHKELKE